MKKLRTYSELCRLATFEERFEYLKLGGKVGVDTFGYDRIFNQMFYRSNEWLTPRSHVIARDLGCDLGMPDREIPDGVRIIVHHMNPITLDDIMNASPFLFDEEYLITTVLNTHNAIHYGNRSLLMLDPIERRRNDTCPWKH